MKYLTLIEMVRMTRGRGHRYVSVDSDENCYSSPDGFEPKTGEVIDWFANSGGRFNRLGSFDLKSKDWKKSLIDVTKIQVT